MGLMYFSTYGECAITMSNIEVQTSYSEYQPAFFFFGCSSLSLENATFNSLYADKLSSLFLFTQLVQFTNVEIISLDNFTSAISTNNNITFYGTHYSNSNQIPFIICDFQSNSSVFFEGIENEICGDLSVFQSFCNFENNNVEYEDYYLLEPSLCPAPDSTSHSQVNLELIFVTLVCAILFIVVILLAISLAVYCYRKSKRPRNYRRLPSRSNVDENDSDDDDEMYHSYDFTGTNSNVIN